jgi:PAS domain S-box-containing protein
MEWDWQQLAGMAAVAGAGVVVLRWMWRAVPRCWRHLRNNMFGIGDLKEDIGKMHETLDHIVTELRPNGGSSIRDSLNRIELRQVLQEQRQKAILTDMSVGVFETDTEGSFIWVNRKYLRMTGRAPSEVNGSGWVNTIAERDRERVISEWQTAIAEEREFEAEYMIITPDNDRAKVAVRTYKMVGQQSEPLGFMGVMTPIICGENPSFE